MSQFRFLHPEWPELFTAAGKAELMVHPDPRTACFYARRTLELAVAWLYRAESSLKSPYQDSLSALIHEPTFRTLLGDCLHAKVRLIKDLGNLAVHSTKPVRPVDSLAAVRELYHFCYWFARTYARNRASQPPPVAIFQADLLPKTAPVPAQTAAQVQKLAAELAERDTKLVELGTAQAALTAELERLRAEVADAKKRNQKQPDTHDYSEAQTRDFFIDLLLKEAGWPLDQDRDREYEVAGMPNVQGKGYVDYVLWGDDGKPLGLVEAKRTKRSPTEGQQQAKLYGDCLERQFGQRPVIFYSNGYDHWMWDDASYPPRRVQGFFKKAELELLIQRRVTRASLASAAISPTIVERYYQTRAIRRITEAFEKDNDRRTLLVMATGAGKTRTVIALSDVLMRCNWVKRVLFLADRVALVNQAVNAFKAHLPSSAPVNLVTDKNTEGRVYVSTYPTMTGLIDESDDGLRRFGVGHFDLIVIDEAHRSVYQKYGAIFDYFDSLLVGLTATPKDEVDRNTYKLFNLETGVPTDAYDIEDAVKDSFLVPPRAVSVPLKFQREGIRYDDLSEDEKDEWDALEWDDEGNVPDRVDSQAVNKWLFNEDTVDKVLEHLMTRGQKVDGGDLLGKTIIFAKNQDHAEFIEQRFNANYPHHKGTFARIITFKTEYAQSLIDAFSNPKRMPQIAISVDMLDTGIDIPEIVNLVFFKLVRSKTKFWQMMGRGTRLRPDLFGPGKHKEFFYIFDYCQNLEFFSQNPAASDGSSNESLSKKLFTARLELIGELDKGDGHERQDGSQAGLRTDTAERLRSEVAGMNLNNFLVRPKRRFVERYSQMEAWEKLGLEQQTELTHEVAGLPSELTDPDLEAKLFDLLILRLQLALLRSEPSFTRLRKSAEEIAGLLEEMDSIPMVREQMPLIQEIQTDDFWQDVTTPMLENVRKKLRALVKLIEKVKRQPVYSDFTDEIGIGQEMQLPGFGLATFAKFREKARAFLREHEDHPAIRKLRQNEALTAHDLSELERLLLQAGIGTAQDLIQAKEASEGLGLFLRSLVGLDRQAAKAAFDRFLVGRNPTSSQIEFVDLIVSHLTEQGYVDASRLYESPFTDLNPMGVEGLFPSDQVGELLGILKEIRLRAAA
jgi:type I restriction enzyme, R subunit